MGVLKGDSYMQGATGGSQLFGYDTGLFYRRLREIEEMTDPREKAEAMQQLARDFPGEMADLQSRQGMLEKMASKDVRSGAEYYSPASNPFSYAVADPFGSIADAAEKGVGMKRLRENQDMVKALRGEQQQVRLDLMNAGLNAQQARPGFNINAGFTPQAQGMNTGLDRMPGPPPGIDPRMWNMMSDEEKRRFLG